MINITGFVYAQRLQKIKPPVPGHAKMYKTFTNTFKIFPDPIYVVYVLFVFYLEIRLAK